MSRQMTSAGLTGIFDAPDPLRRDETAHTMVARGSEGLLYIADVARERGYDEGTSEGFMTMRVTIHPMMDASSASDARGPMLSRTRVNVLTGSLAYLWAERGVPTDEDGYFPKDQTFTEADAEDALARFTPSVITDALHEALAPFGVPDDGEHGVFVMAVDSDDGATKRSVPKLVEEVWRDGEWQPTVSEVTAAVQQIDPAATDEAVKKALQRGPYKSDEKRPARWRLDPSRALKDAGE